MLLYVNPLFCCCNCLVCVNVVVLRFGRICCCEWLCDWLYEGLVVVIVDWVVAVVVDDDVVDGGWSISCCWTTLLSDLCLRLASDGESDVVVADAVLLLLLFKELFNKRGLGHGEFPFEFVFDELLSSECESVKSDPLSSSSWE